jgi:hypothetical protein
LQPRARAEFLQAVAAEIENQPHRRAGAVYRARRELQRKFSARRSFMVRANTTERIRQKVPTEKINQ